MILQPPPDQAAALRDLAARARRSAGRRPALIAVTSGKGGAGKTVLSVNLALEFAGAGLRCLLVDLDPGLANVDVHLRLRATHTVFDVLRGEVSFEDALIEGPRGLTILPGGTLEDQSGGDLVDGAPRQLFGALGRPAAGAEVVVIDCGAGLGPWVRRALVEADLNLVVTQPDPASVTDGYAVCKLAASLGARAFPALVVNRARTREEAFLTATRLRKVARRFLGLEPEFAGFLPESAAVTRSVRHQLPVLLASPPAELALRFRHLAARCRELLEAPRGAGTRS